MTLSDQVCSLRLAKRLKELGVKQESLFYYQMSYGGGQESARLTLGRDPDPFNTDEYNISAFTVAELGEILPETIDQNDKHSPYSLNIHKRSFPQLSVWFIEYGFDKNRDKTIRIAGKTLADSFAEMLIRLIENNLWKPKG